MRGRRLLVLDAVLLAAYLVAANPALTGAPAHEWLGLLVLAALLVHVAAHADWVAGAVQRARRGGARPGRLAVDALLAATLAVCVVSGVMVSGAVLPALGLYATGYYFWDPLHAVSAKALLALLLVHLALNWKAVAAALGRKDEGKEPCDGER